MDLRGEVLHIRLRQLYDIDGEFLAVKTLLLGVMVSTKPALWSIVC